MTTIQTIRHDDGTVQTLTVGGLCKFGSGNQEYVLTTVGAEDCPRVEYVDGAKRMLKNWAAMGVEVLERDEAQVKALRKVKLVRRGL